MFDAASLGAPSPGGADEGGCGSPAPALRCAGAGAAEEKRLLSVAQPAATKVFEHVRRVAQKTHNPVYLPKHSDEPTAYKQLEYVRTKHNNGKLTVADYQLLARIPRILGPTVYGDVDPRDDGYRWTFASAGVDVHSDTFPTEAAAAEDLRPLQQALYPGWEDPEKRAAHLQRLLRLRAQEKLFSD
jgi:hypothetical protein